MASIFKPREKNSYPDPKLHVSTGHLPPYISPSQPPTKKSPWRQITQTPYIHTVTMILPTSLYDMIWPNLTQSQNDNNITQPSYAKLFLKLEDILTGSFFTTYIKTPSHSISMLSEGIPGVDDIFSLHDGVLRLDLVKETYQKAGLQGQSLKTSGARKHVKEYFRVEFNLREAAMVGGKKGFERLLSAARNVLNQSLIWIYRDSSDIKDVAPLSQHHAQVITMTPQVRYIPSIPVPAIMSQLQHPHKHLSSPLGVETLDDFYELTEWLDLLGLNSPRVCQPDDNVDPYISRYAIPESDAEEAAADLKVISWTIGLTDPSWLTRLLVHIIKQSRMSNAQHSWLAVSVTGHRTDATGRVDGYMILLSPDAAEIDDTIRSDETEATDVDESTGGVVGDVMMEGDVDGADTAAVAATVGGTAADIDASRNTGGLRRFTCFQFVDA